MSSAITQSALLNHEVYLIEYVKVFGVLFIFNNQPLLTDISSRLDNHAREKMRHLRCLCFVRPSPESIQFLIDELREPKYGEYHFCGLHRDPFAL